LKKKHVSPHFLASEIPPSTLQDALFHIIPVPYERSVSYGIGTAKGPEAILESSQQLELFDGTSIPAEHGIYTHPPIDCEGKPEAVLKKIKATVASALTLEKIPVLLGGEHTVSVGAFQAIKETIKNVGIIQFDAHADLRNTYEGTPHSHACVMHRAMDLKIPFFQIGVRSLSYEEYQLRREKRIPHLDASTLHETEIPLQILPADFPENIYITFDVDAFDPSIMPATGTPEPGGLAWHQTFELLERIVSARQIIGFDVVELAPVSGMHFPEFTVARFIYNLLGLITRKIENS
jgi:agmatinase